MSISEEKLIPVSSRLTRKVPSMMPMLGKFCTPEKPSSFNSFKNTGMITNGSVPLTPAITGVRLHTGSTSSAISLTI